MDLEKNGFENIQQQSVGNKIKKETVEYFGFKGGSYIKYLNPDC